MNIQLLKKVIPFKWRVQSEIKSNPPKLRMIAYVDARDVAEHLDEIIGAENWCDKYYEVKGNLYCSLGIKIGDEWVFKSDCGTESKTEKEKGESSDAFKRAAVKWGINRDAYRVGIVEIQGKNYNGKNYPCDNDGKFLKGQFLYDYCNNLAKITDLENYDLDHSEDYENLIELFNLKRDNLNEEEVKRYTRIIENKEYKQYELSIDELKEL